MELPQHIVKLVMNGNGFDATPEPSFPAKTRCIDPRSLAHKKRLSKAARAILGAEILDGNIPLTNLTRAVVATVVGASTGYIDKARQLSPEARQDVVHEKRPLVLPKPPRVLGPQERLAAIVDEIGLDRVLNLLNSFELTNAVAA